MDDIGQFQLAKEGESPEIPSQICCVELHQPAYFSACDIVPGGNKSGNDDSLGIVLLSQMSEV